MLISDEQTFEKLFREHYNLLCNCAGKFITNKQIAEDIVQNFFIAVWEKKYLSLTPDIFLPYACRAIKNACIDYYRAVIVKEDFLSTLANEWQSELTDDDENEFLYTKEVQQALLKLPEKCKSVFLLKCVSDLKYKEIAEISGISVNTVKYHLGEAFRIMKEELNHLYLLFILLFI